jgi:hypothetical protein
MHDVERRGTDLIYELTTLLFSPGTLRQTLPKIRTLLGGDASLLGIFTVDVGNINELIVLRRYVRPDDLALNLPGQRSIYDDAGEGLLRVRVEPLLQLSYVPDPEPGRYGQLYELRAYKLLPDGLGKMVAAWQEPLAQRVRLSPVLMAAHSIDGDEIRFFNSGYMRLQPIVRTFYSKLRRAAYGRHRADRVDGKVSSTCF